MNGTLVANPTDATPAGEDDLVRRAQIDPAAFGQLYQLHYTRILNYIYRRTMSVTAAEELASNTFFNALRHLDRFRGGGSFAAWLYRIAGNEIRMHRRQWRRAHAECRQDFQRITIAQRQDDREIDRAQTISEAAHVLELLLTLSDKYQAVLALRYLEGLSVDQIADVLGKSAGTVKSLVSRGLAQLRQRIENEVCHERHQSDRANI